VKTFKMVVSLMILGIFLVAAPAMAADPVGNQVKVVSGYGPYEVYPGGEFTLQVSNDLSWILGAGYVAGKTSYVTGATPTFQTFCLETNEYISSNAIYNVSISNGAKNGGIGGATGGIDLISLGTANLYSAFATGVLAGFDYTDPGRSISSGNLPASAGELQNAFWMLEDEMTWNASNAFIDSLLDINNSESYWKGNANGAYSVAVLNMGAPGQGQDQLVMANVPEPSTLILLGICLFGAAIAVKKFHLEV
jgi:hypothetical protein